MNQLVNNLSRGLHLKSLRWRYLVVAGSLGALVLISTWLVGIYVGETSYRSTEHISEREVLAQEVHGVRDSIWEAESALQSYLLSSRAESGQVVREQLAAAARQINSMAGSAPVSGDHLQHVLDQLHSGISALIRETERLLEMRADATLRFPARELIEQTLWPQSRAFLTAADIALSSISEQPLTDASSQLYRHIERLRYSWIQMTSSFRLYLVMRTGMFGDDQAGLARERQDMEQYYRQIRHYYDLIGQDMQPIAVDLQVEDAYQVMGRVVGQWYEHFSDVKSLHESANWRLDIPQTENVVQPLFRNLWSGLGEIDRLLQASAREDVSVWTDVGSRISTLLWILAPLALLFIGLGFVFFERTVLKPMAQVSSAMKSVASGEPAGKLAMVSSREAQDLVEAFSEMRAQVQERQLALQHQALHDALTGLPNRVLLRDRIYQQILVCSRQSRQFCLMMMDLDRFKEINDTLGHHAGDRVLRQVSERLAGVLRKSDTVARLGGDEFAVLLPDSDVQQAARIADNISEMIEQPFELDGRNLALGVSVGIAQYPRHGDDADTLLQRADVAMYVAKKQGLNHAVYSESQDQHSLGRLALISDLRNALKEDSLELFYQPKRSMRSGEILGVEALLRWRDERWEHIGTEELIAIAEETALIKPLTFWVLDHALQQYNEWRGMGMELNVAVNLSAWNLQNSELDIHVGELLEKWNVPASALNFEVTESAMMHYPERALDTLRYIHHLGVELAVDDYGTGFSSLAYLKEMPVSTVKIDKSFVRDMIQDDDDAVIVRSTIDLAHNLGLSVIAEGVETREVWELLQILGCDAAQGNYISPPLQAAELEVWLGDNTDLLCA